MTRLQSLKLRLFLGYALFASLGAALAASIAIESIGALWLYGVIGP